MTKSLSPPLASAALLLGVLLCSSPGKADFRVCNFSGSTTNMAFGYYEQQDGWSSRGWMKLVVGECKVALHGPLQTGTYYLYGHNEDGHVFGGRSAENGAFFCTQKPKFKFRSNEYSNGQTLNCEASGLKTTRFMAVNVTQPEFTYTLSPSVGQIGSKLAPLVRQGLESGANASTGAGTQTTLQNSGSSEPPPSGSMIKGQTATSAAVPPSSIQAASPAEQKMPPPSAQPTGRPHSPSKDGPGGTACQRFPNLC